MLSFHEILIELRKALGYEENKGGGGLCTLYAEKGIDAFLVGEYETVFFKRCEYIEEHYKSIPVLLQQARKEIRVMMGSSSDKQEKLSDDERQMISDIAAFYDQGELYMYTHWHSDVFNTFLRQHNIQEISQYAQSDALEKLGGRVCLATFFGMYTLDELTQYAELFNELAKGSKHNFSISLACDNHRIGLCYSYERNGWLLINANEPFRDIIPANKESNVILAQSILSAFFDRELGISGFQTQIFTTGHQQESMQKSVDVLLDNERFKALHEINLKHITKQSKRGTTLVWLAARAGDIAALTKILEFGLTVALNLPSSGATPVFIAAQDGQFEVLQILLDAKIYNGHNVDFHQPSGDSTPMLVAAREGHAETLNVLFAAGESLNQELPTGETVAFLAASYSRLAVLQFLADAKMPDGSSAVDFNKRRPKDGATPAMIAAQDGNVGALQILIDAKTADGEPAVDFELSLPVGGETAVFMAAQRGHNEALRMLINAKTSNGYPRIDLRKSDRKDGVSLECVATYQGHSETLRLLIEARIADGSFVDVNKNCDAGNPACIAADKGDVNTFRVLTEARTSNGEAVVDLNQSNNYDSSPLMLASGGGHVDILRILISAKTPEGHPRVDFNKSNSNGATAIFIAILQNQVGAVRLLVEAKMPDGSPAVDINKYGPNGESAIHLAALMGNLDIVTMLVEAGADLKHLFKGCSALSFAKMEGHIEIMALLEKSLYALEKTTLDNQSAKSSDVSFFSAAEANKPKQAIDNESSSASVELH